MPRTETCGQCDGAGQIDDFTCTMCAGNGYVETPITFENMTYEEATGLGNNAVHAALKTMREEEPALPGFDLTNTKPVPGRMANQTWRILEEQRMAAEETIAECEAEIERWSDKMVDAIKAKRICEAGQAALEGEA